MVCRCLLSVEISVHGRMLTSCRRRCRCCCSLVTASADRFAHVFCFLAALSASFKACWKLASDMGPRCRPAEAAAGLNSGSCVLRWTSPPLPTAAARCCRESNACRRHATARVLLKFQLSPAAPAYSVNTGRSFASNAYSKAQAKPASSSDFPIPDPETLNSELGSLNFN